MNEEEIKKEIFRILRNIAPDTTPETLMPEDSISKTLAIDSFDYLRFMVSLDEKFKVKIPEEDYGKIQKLKELIAYILTNKKV